MELKLPPRLPELPRDTLEPMLELLRLLPTVDRVLLPLKRFQRDELHTVPRLMEPEPRLEDTEP